MYNIFVLISFDVIIYTYYFLKGTDAMLKKSTYIFLSVLLCIPLILVIYFSVSVNTEKPSADLLIEITVDDPSGNKSFFDDKDSHELFSNVVGNAFKVSTPMRDISDETPAVVTHVEKEQQYSYNYYMSSDPEECYFTNTRGETYQLDADDAKDLLALKEFIYVYDNHAVPTVTLSANGKDETVHATAFSEWFFLKGKEFAEGIPSSEEQYSGSIMVSAEDDVTANFSVTPDRCSVTVFNGNSQIHYADWASYNDTAEIGEKLFSDLASKMAFTADTRLICEINAEWLETEDKSYYGNVTYTTDIIFDVPAGCDSTPVDKKLSPGEFTFVKLHNVNAGEILKFVPEDDKLVLPETKLHKIGDMTFCYLPIPLTTPAGTYKVNLMSGDTAIDSFTIGINSKTFGTATVTNHFGSGALDVTKKEFEELLVTLCTKSEEAHLWSDAKSGTTGNKYIFVNPVTGSNPSTSYFGTKVEDDPNLVQSLPYLRTAMFIEAAAGKNVNATASGKIAAVGENNYSGKYVVIDHGFGMISVYENLSEVSVAMGDAVKIGSPVGKTGKTGYASTDGIRFSIMIDGVFVNPFTNYRYGISY